MGVAAGDHVRADVLNQPLDVRRGGLVEASLTPLVGDLVPVAAVHPSGAGADRGGHDRDVGGECRCRRPVRRRVEQVAGRHAQPGQQQPGRIQLGRAGRGQQDDGR